MTFATQHNPTVSFPVLVQNVYQLTKATPTVPASYRITYSFIGRNLGSITPLTTYFIYDNSGIPFSIFAVGSGTVDVYDNFNTGECPMNGKNAIIVKSVWSGRAPYLGAVNLQYLHPIALLNINRFNLDILWSNDSNAIEISLDPTTTPIIQNYQSDQTINGITVNLAQDYGEKPTVSLYQTLSATEKIERTEKPYFVLDGSGLIDSISFGDMGEITTGLIIKISKS